MNCRLLLIIGTSLLLFSFATVDDWGFYGHKLINRMAVYTCPEDLIEFYKRNISYISDHAVDPDKRRYAVNGEAIKHYIDLDNWGKDAINTLDRDLFKAITFHSNFYVIDEKDTVLLFDTLHYAQNELVFTNEILSKYLILKSQFQTKEFSNWMKNYAWREHDPLQWIVVMDSLKISGLPNGTRLWIQDLFTTHGILPYNLDFAYRRLVNAFRAKDHSMILKLSAYIGHYIGDAHVPLHTTKNYNGQLTNQNGIHAFWESRIPELLAEKEFDFLVGAAEYIPNTNDYFWKIIGQSHAYVDSVLSIEKRISEIYPKDEQYCFETRLGVLTKLPCETYTRLYNEMLDQQVERRMQASILAIGSIWTSAWVDAGQPILETNQIDEESIVQSQDSLHVQKREIKVRDHE